MDGILLFLPDRSSDLRWCARARNWGPPRPKAEVLEDAECNAFASARQGNGAALDLASALVKIAKNIPPGMRPTMPAGVFLLGDEETKGVKSRVRRLIALSSTDYQTGARYDDFKKFLVWTPPIMLLASLAISATSPVMLSRVHFLLEQVVSALR